MCSRRHPILSFLAAATAVLLSTARLSTSDNNSLEYPIHEELPANELVGNIVRDFGLDQLYSPSVLDSLRFTFLTQPAPPDAPDRPYFAIDERTGDIFVTANRLDRDKICPRLVHCVVQFDVAVQPIEFFQIIKAS
jgi:Cadherin-like